MPNAMHQTHVLLCKATKQQGWVNEGQLLWRQPSRVGLQAGLPPDWRRGVPLRQPVACVSMRSNLTSTSSSLLAFSGRPALS